MATPPIRGIGSEWIFLEFGISTSLSLWASLIRMGISKIVMIVESRNVENKIIKNIYKCDITVKDLYRGIESDSENAE
jgi:hypothetical protein